MVAREKTSSVSSTTVRQGWTVPKKGGASSKGRPSFSKSMSSNLSHTPMVGIRYSFPIRSSTYCLTAYLSTSVVYSGL